MTEPDRSFDSFYTATRRALLHQAFALTGDLKVAQAAVRDAYVNAWQHWRKVSRLEDPLDWVRPRAWQHAQRRRTARIWHRGPGVTERQRAVLDALSGLPAAQRRVLVLVELAGLDLSATGRELGVTPEVARRNHELASSHLAEALTDGTAAGAGAGAGAAAGVRPALLELSGALDQVSLPRGPIVRRSGRKRRQARAVLGTAAAAAVALASGAFAYQPGAADAVADLSLSRPSTAAGDAAEGAGQVDGSGDAGASSAAASGAAAGTADGRPTAANLLDQDQIGRLGPGQRWTVTRTDDNTGGDGINTVCQQSRFADPDGYSALVREFTAAGSPRRSAVQTVETSRSAAQAADGFDTTVGWYAGCRLGRLQVLNSYRVDNIGDEAEVLTLRIWKSPVTTVTVAVARTGAVTTSTVGTTVGGAAPPAGQVTQSLADSVAMLCASSGASDCAKQPTYQVVPPPPSGEERGLLAVADLPPVGRIDQPWVGTRPAPARTNPSATPCDRADFGGAERTRTRTYLIPQANLPTRFGLAETYGRYRSSADASAFLAKVRASMAGCEDRNLASKVGGAFTERHGPVEVTGWDVSTEVSQDSSVRFRVGFARVGATVAQVTFAPSGSDDMSDAAFRSLLVRAGDRLRELD